MDNLEKENKRLKYLIFVLLIITLLAVGYLTYMLYFNEDGNNTDIDNEVEEKLQEEDNKVEEQSSESNISKNDNTSNKKEELYKYENFAESVYINENQTVFLTLWSNNTFSYRINNKYYFGTCYIDGEYIYGTVLMGEDSDKAQVILKENMSLNFKITKDNELYEETNQVNLHSANQPTRAGGDPKDSFDN